MKNTRKIFAVLSLNAMLLQAIVLPAQAMTLELTGNGVSSDSEIKIKTEQRTEVNQENVFNVSNNINASANTGSNRANRNTGGDANIDTGNATSLVSVTNAGNTNEAVVDCCASAGNTDVLISGNGDSTDNKVDLKNKNVINVNQENRSNIANTVNNNAVTGWNDANRNTGGSVTIATGKAMALTEILNGGNMNSAVVSGNSNHGGVSARILGNGVKSDNEIKLGLEHRIDLSQENSARVRNHVDTDAVSGKNDANRNTGGDVNVDTGDAHVEVYVDNAVNFNFADVDCGCLFDVTAKVAGNGDSSDNKIRAELKDRLEVEQENSCRGGRRHYPLYEFEGLLGGYGYRGRDCLSNDIYADAYSGFNRVNRNTGEHDADPSVESGNAKTMVEVSNAGNSNVFGDVSDFEFPWQNGNGSGVNVNITFDLRTLLGLLGISLS